MNRTVVDGLIAGGVVSIALAAAGCGTGTAQAGVPGSALFGSCVACHGPSGEGNKAIGAPRIAGMPQWYLAQQLTRFQTGLRGKHPDDAEGLRMRAMSQQMLTAAEIAAVSQYVAGLSPVTNPATLHTGDAAAAQGVYARCVPCHGARGEGNQQVNAPPLAGLDDWYVASQLRKFRAGMRGGAEGDAVGPAMRAMALSVEPATVDELAAYVHSLQK